MVGYSLRVRGLLDRWSEVLVVAVVILAVIGGWVTYGAHVDPGTTTPDYSIMSVVEDLSASSTP